MGSGLSKHRPLCVKEAGEKTGSLVGADTKAAPHNNMAANDIGFPCRL